MKCYKGFDKDLKCRDFQYEVGKEYTEEKAEICKSGFHSCERPIDVFAYYPPATSRFCEVELDENGQRSSDDSKRVGKQIKICAEIGILGIAKAQIEYVKSHCTNEHNAEPGKPATAGDFGAATAGDFGAATSGGRSSVGENGAALARGNNTKTKGGLGAILVIVEENSFDCGIKNWCAGVVDGEKIKPDTWYQCVDGEFSECEE